MKQISKRAIAAVTAVMLMPCGPVQAQEFDWHMPKNRLLIARALNHWADFCSNVFLFQRVPKLPDAALKPKVNSHLLLSPTPDSEVQRWAGWLPYADPGSDVAKATQDRAADALLAAKADPSSATEAEKLYTDTMRSYFTTVYGKCREGAGEPFISANLYSGEGDFEKAMSAATMDFQKEVRELDKPATVPSPEGRHSGPTPLRNRR